MTNILTLISQVESITIEFKEFESKLNKDVFEIIAPIWSGLLATEQVAEQATAQVVSIFCEMPKSSIAIMRFLQHGSNQKYISRKENV